MKLNEINSNEKAKTTLILSAFLIALALVAIAVTLVVTDPNREVEADAYFDYDYSYDAMFYDDTGLPVLPTIGNIFIIIDITIKNDHYDDGIKTNLDKLIWRMVIDDDVRNPNLATLSHPDYKDLTIKKGERVDFTVVFEVPLEDKDKKFYLGYNYITDNIRPCIRYDSTLREIDDTSVEIMIGRTSWNVC